ncbi:MAG: hypothetical protein ACUVRD_09110 [Bacteroidia bacterium]
MRTAFIPRYNFFAQNTLWVALKDYPEVQPPLFYVVFGLAMKWLGPSFQSFGTSGLANQDPYSGIYKILTAFLGDHALNVVLFLFLLAASYMTLVLVRNLWITYRLQRWTENAFFTLSWLAFLLIMPFSNQVWEDYLLLVLPFYAAAV